MQKLTKLFPVSILAASLTLAGCSSSGVQQEPVQMSESLRSAYLDTEQAISDLAARTTQAVADNLAYFAPKKTDKALDAWSKAKKQFGKVQNKPTTASESKLQDILAEAETANLLFDSAYETKAFTEQKLARSFEEFAYLEGIGAPEVFAKDYKSAHKQLDKLVAALARNGEKADVADDQAELLEFVKSIEINTIEETSLVGVRASFAEIDNRDFEKTVPVSLERIKASLLAAEETIAADPRAAQAIDSAVAQVRFEIDHTQHIFTHVEALAEADDLEGALLQFEEQLLSIAEAMNTEDVRDMPIDQQVMQLMLTASELNAAAELAPVAEAEVAAEAAESTNQ